MGYFEWNKQDVERAINSAIAEGRTSVGLSMDHNTHANELQVVRWAQEMGHEAKLEMERVSVTFKK